MSWAVVRGEPTAAQRYLDDILSAVTAASATASDTGTARASAGSQQPAVSVAALLLHCMRQEPDSLFMINGATGERFSKAEMLALALRAGRALRHSCGGVGVDGAAGGEGGRDAGSGSVGATRALAAVRSHPRAVAAYLAALLAGVPLVMVDPASTTYELSQYLSAAEPAVVFCDAALKETLRQALATASPPVIAVDGDDFDRFIAGHSDDVDSFALPHMGPDDEILLLPTSGSTGLPKSAVFTNRGTLAQIPVPWTYQTQFPRPTPLVLVLTTPQWTTFTMMVTGAITFGHALLMSTCLLTHDHVRHMIHTYKPTFALITPTFVKGLMEICEPEHLSSMETVHLIGSQITSEVYAAVKEKFPPTCTICDGFGMTEVQGYVIMADPKGPPRATGQVVNIFDYKLVNEKGEVTGVDDEAELYIKSIALVKGYLKNDELQKNLTEDGWLPTGDTFDQDKDGNLYYRRRIKFSFKYMNQLVSPEEVERVASGVSGVAQLVVCCSRRGPAAALVLRNGADPDRVRRDIHAAVDSTLSEHKRLRGGVFVVADHELPRTHSGKLHRARVEQLIARLIEQGA